ncbi:transposase [Exiguobacterium sp. SL-10]|jgi:IS605 OrfB family transposase|uniref:RNA-guided endonuclease InsQ/TnpB family protein n=1 Tax=unclassified Exiguobacterium TaxID=2644629 RepID=UPI00103F73A6|nr:MULTISPECIES: RNA-guided endonuclease TnpB family protein [unclassified Exiguobacterium]TCI22323.1 transposase [Exiguobacterium sp. SL-9]TCI28546.1 transposase [Exiguobacterium sp. SL-10]
MSQKLTVNIKLNPSKEQESSLNEMSRLYVDTVNMLVAEMVEVKLILKKTSKDVKVILPSVVKNQAIRDAQSLFYKAKKKKFENVSILKKPICFWNNQSYTFDCDYIYIPIILDGKVKRAAIQAHMIDKDDRNFSLLKHKLGALRITQKSNKWIAQIAITVPTVEKNDGKIMGVDLGLKVPAVAITDCGKPKFFGNGRENKYMRRMFQSTRKELSRNKKVKAVKNLGNKEQRWMRDKDHKISRKIVEFAKVNDVSVIRLEKLTKLRQTARTSRKNTKNLHTWSFYRLSKYIEYKAKLDGIKIEYVNPAYTSQMCPSCGKKNKAKDRVYSCSCGLKKHRDLIGAMNIRWAPVVDGNSPSA